LPIDGKILGGKRVGNPIYADIVNKIQEYGTIIIHRHLRPDPDALGSQNGLASLIRQAYPEKKVFVVGENEESLSYLGSMDSVSDEAYEGALVIVTDTANQPRVSDKRFVKGAYLIKIDHHPNEDPYGDICLVETQASSSSEIIAKISFSTGDKLPMNDAAARLLYAGIVGDTGRFLYPAATAVTMEIAAKLMQFDFSASDISQMMNTNSLKTANLSGFVLQSLTINDVGVASIILSQEILGKFGAVDSDTAPVVPLPGTVEGVLCWGIFVEQTNGTYRCRLRSKGPIINEVAKRHGGGGHPLASGANAKDESEINDIILELEELAIEWQNTH
jgi:phosphoesterase RecJ-like protein